MIIEVYAPGETSSTANPYVTWREAANDIGSSVPRVGDSIALTDHPSEEQHDVLWTVTQVVWVLKDSQGSVPDVAPKAYQRLACARVYTK